VQLKSKEPSADLQQPAPADVRDTLDDPRDREIAALRAQLREKDRLVGALSLQVGAARAGEGATDKKGGSEAAMEQALSRLDERLFGGVLAGPKVREVEAAMEIATRELPSSVKSKIDCSTEMCRVAVEGAEQELDKHCGQLIEHIPKKFSGAIVLPDGDGQRAVYAATRQELLSVK
jgi:hypothetical protein